MSIDIKVSEENAGLIELFLSSANGRSVAHTYNSYSDIERISDAAEDMLAEFGFDAKSRYGAVAVDVSGDEMPSTFSSKRTVTRVILFRGNNGCILKSVCAEKIYRSSGYLDLILSKDQEEFVINHDNKTGSIH